MHLPDYSNNPNVQAQIRWFQHHPHSLIEMTKKAQPYIYYIHQQTLKNNLPSELALLAFIESSYNPFAQSSVASGMWQFTYGTAKRMGLRINPWYDGRRDIQASTRAALNYLNYLHKNAKGDWVVAVASYNAGPGAIRKALRRANYHYDSPWDLRLPSETKLYIAKFLAIVTIIKDPQHYGMKLPPIANQPYLAEITVHSQINLRHAARIAKIDSKLMHVLNAGFSQSVTEPHHKAKLLLPIRHAEALSESLAA